MNLSPFPAPRPYAGRRSICPVDWTRDRRSRESLLVPAAEFGVDAPPGRPLPDLLPDDLRGCTFESLDPRRAPEAYRVCRSYADYGQSQDRLSLFLFGHQGAGKSSLAAAILHQVVAQAQDPHHAHFWPLRRSLQAIRQTQQESPAQSLYLADLLAQPLPILDQIEGPASLWEASHLELLLPLLCDEDRRMVLTTDLGLEELHQALGDYWVLQMLSVCHAVCVG